jgi:tetratricopeptide (TPR) repeat protein
LQWLAYSYLQQGRYREARKLLERMEADARANPGGSTGWYWTAMRAAYIVETRQWEDPMLRVELDTSGVREIAAPGAELFARGLAALKSGDRVRAEKLLAEMKSLRTEAEVAAGSQSGHSHWAAQVSPAGLKTVSILEQEIEALLRLADGDTEKALRALEEAARAEEAMSFDFGPPTIVKPTRELLGEILLEQGRAQEAQRAFERALQRAPRRVLSLLGQARAARQAGDSETSERSYGELRQIWRNADADLPELAEIKRPATRAGQ